MVRTKIRSVGSPYRASLDGGDHSRRALLRRMQIALKPASKALGLHRIFIRGKGRKYVTADSTFKRMQIDAKARWLDTGEPHLGFALRTGRAPKCNRWNGERRALRLGHGESLRIAGSATGLSVTGKSHGSGGDGTSMRRCKLERESIRAPGKEGAGLSGSRVFEAQGQISVCLRSPISIRRRIASGCPGSSLSTNEDLALK
jgi:hypothetical protein